MIRWSNGSVWQKVYTGPTAIDLNDNWTDGLTVSNLPLNGFFLAIDMSHTHRPNAVGFAVSPTRFQVSFPDDPNTTVRDAQAGQRPDARPDHLVERFPLESSTPGRGATGVPAARNGALLTRLPGLTRRPPARRR